MGTCVHSLGGKRTVLEDAHEDDGDSIIEDGLAEDESEDDRIGVHRAHDGEGGDGVSRADQCAEEVRVERRREVERIVHTRRRAEGAGGAGGVDALADNHSGDERAEDGEEQDGAEVAKKVRARERESRLEDDRRQEHVEEELLVKGDQRVCCEALALLRETGDAEERAKRRAEDDRRRRCRHLHLLGGGRCDHQQDQSE